MLSPELIDGKTEFDQLIDLATKAFYAKTESAVENIDLLPEHLKKFATNYLAELIALYAATESKINKESIAISVNELPALHVQETSTIYNETDVSLSGDAALGLSYFKGLNAGLESLAKYFAIMRPAIEEGLDDKSLLREKLADYQAWYRPYADKKVKEVEQYSTFRVRSLMKLVKIYRELKFNFSQQEVVFDHEGVIDSYYKLLGQPSPDQEVRFNFYPHRSYDPDIKLGQFDYVPLTYSMKKIGKLFTSFFRPYRDDYQFAQDFKQPFVGLVNVTSGIVKLVAGTFTLDIYRFGDGLFSLIRGLLEIATTPLAWTVKPIIRLAITAAFDSPKIEENSGLKKLVTLGEELLEDQTDDDFSFEKMQRILGLCNDLHRKLSKQVHREQETEIDLATEDNLIKEITSPSTPMKLEKVKNYFTLFGGKFQEPGSLFTPEEEDMLERSYTA
ncbi:hypothetical protein [Legionella drozanskii]|uniref:Uncharacterized protein n=1 Tax=Legionella drozanskii LLAP-1 TaxID=1212489 RepID=A0A0W0SML8_9GAMM|nr:hypothetical protein [Legionella drozanskii]KTC84608.1 hypothetical protein Ldro_2772 [Legionella drozanskii LLAP-1]